MVSVQWFFLTWFPTYLVRYKHIELAKAGMLASLPFMAAFVGVLLSPALGDITGGVSSLFGLGPIHAHVKVG